jgi:SAM-dependent methyltransferase
VQTNFRCPLGGEPLQRGTDSNLYDMQGRLVFENHDGTYDFVVDADSRKEREFYDQTYANGGWHGTTEPLDSIDYERLWSAEAGSREYLASIGDVAGKKILLIGNGTSLKELLFVERGADVTFTDLSLKGVLYVKDLYRRSTLSIERPDGCEFHAVNAYHLPFVDNTFDIVCADAAIHHLDDLETLFSEIHRCLKAGGVCRFLDTAFSPSWQGAKSGVLRPLLKHVHKRCGISPEDQKATARGGYTREELEQLRRKIGFCSTYYRRVALVDYLLWRARCKFDWVWILGFRPAVRWIDSVLAKTPIMTRQGISLVLGFDK